MKIARPKTEEDYYQHLKGGRELSEEDEGVARTLAYITFRAYNTPPVDPVLWFSSEGKEAYDNFFRNLLHLKD